MSMRGWQGTLAACLFVVVPLPAVTEPRNETEAVLQALAEVGHDPDDLILRLAEVFDEVAVTDQVTARNGADQRFAPFGSFSVAIEMRRGGQDVGVVGCQGFGLDDLDVLAEDYRNDPSRFAVALKGRVSAGTARRVLCHFHTWDGTLPALAIAAQSKTWGAAIGEATPDATAQAPDRWTVVDTSRQGTGRPWAMTVSRAAAGEVRAVLIMLVFDERAAPS